MSNVVTPDKLHDLVLPLEISDCDRFADVRRAAGARLAGQRLPTLKDEEWRFTPLTALTSHTYEVTAPASVLLPEISRFLLPEAEDQRLVFVDGRFAPDLSLLAPHTPGLKLAPLSALDDAPLVTLGLVAPPGPAMDGASPAAVVAPGILGRHAACGSDCIHPTGDVFSDLSARYLQEGAAVLVAEGVNVTAPVQLLFVSTGRAEGAGPQPYAAPWTMVRAGRNSHLTLVQTYVSLNETPYFVNPITEVDLHDGAHVTHVRVQSDSRSAFHIERVSAVVRRDANYGLHNFSLGARLSRLSADVTLEQPGATTYLNGLALLAGDQESDSHTKVFHQAPSCVSRQTQKQVLDERSHAVFNGKIVVAKGAQQTDSAQSCRGLLLADTARLDAKPELEINADDVKCAHGAAIGQIDAEQLFYLKSRGLDETAARDLLTYAFAGELIELVPIESLRKQLREVVLGKTSQARDKQGATSGGTR